MTPHFHSGPFAFLAITAYAILGISLVRLGAGVLTQHPKTEQLGRTIGSLVTYGGIK